jgi:hypothetical protein
MTSQTSSLPCNPLGFTSTAVGMFITGKAQKSLELSGAMTCILSWLTQSALERASVALKGFTWFHLKWMDLFGSYTVVVM